MPKMKKRIQQVLVSVLFGLLIAEFTGCGKAINRDYDIVVYGGTSAGVVAAIQAARMGNSVILIEPGAHLGGLTAGGLGQTDIGNKNAIGGIAREFYELVFDHYANDDVWVNQKRTDYKHFTKEWQEEKTWWKFEPHVAEQILKEMLAKDDVPVIFKERLDLENGVEKSDSKILLSRWNPVVNFLPEFLSTLLMKAI